MEYIQGDGAYARYAREKMEGIQPGSILSFFPKNCIEYRANSCRYLTLPSEVQFRVEAIFCSAIDTSQIKLIGQGYGIPLSEDTYGEGPVFITVYELINHLEMWEVVGFEAPYLAMTLDSTQNFVEYPSKGRRISRNKLFMEIAKLVAMRSTCGRAEVGAVLIKDNRIISMGYVGSPSGEPHCLDVGCEIGPNGGCIRTIHAEVNCLAFSSKEGIKTEGTTLYCTLSPCRDCAKLLINAGIKKVVYLNKYRDTSGIDLLAKVGIEVTEYKEDEND